MTQQLSAPRPEAPCLTWHQALGQQVAEQLGVDPQRGLSALEAQTRLERYGANELKGKASKPAIVLFLLQFNQPLLYILLIAGSIKALLGSWVNAGVIWGVTVINSYPRIDSIPFESEFRYMATLHQQDTEGQRPKEYLRCLCLGLG